MSCPVIQATSVPKLEYTRPRRGVLWPLALCIIAIAFTATLVSRTPGQPQLQTTKEVPAQTPANPVAVPPLICASGRIEPVRQVKISPEVSGEIIELPVKEGQQVAKGQLLLRIKADYYVANRDEAQGNFKSALATIDIAKARLQEAKAELKRSQDLFENKLISISTFESAKAQCEINKAQLSNAEGQLETARGRLARAQDDLDKTAIFSPIAGTVARLNSQVGERVVGTATMAGTDVMTLADLKHMEARVEVSETDIRSVKCGEKVRLELTAFPERAFEGTVVQMATSCDPSSRVPSGNGGSDAVRFVVRILVDDGQELRPGMSVKAQFTHGTTDSALAGRPATAKPSG